MKHNPNQSTMFDDFAKGVYRAGPAVKSCGKTPETREASQAAAKSIKPNVATKRLQVLRYIVQCGVRGATDEEQQIGLGMKDNTQRPRRVDLANAGLIRPAGSRPTSSGRGATVWVATPEGMGAIDG